MDEDESVLLQVDQSVTNGGILHRGEMQYCWLHALTPNGKHSSSHYWFIDKSKTFPEARDPSI